MKLDNLSTQFSLETKTIKKLINGLILKKLISGRWNKDTLEILDSCSYNLKFKKYIEDLEINIKNIADNNITLIESAIKASSK